MLEESETADVTLARIFIWEWNCASGNHRNRGTRRRQDYEIIPVRFCLLPDVDSTQSEQIMRVGIRFSFCQNTDLNNEEKHMYMNDF